MYSFIISRCSLNVRRGRYWGCYVILYDHDAELPVKFDEVFQPVLKDFDRNHFQKQFAT